MKTENNEGITLIALVITIIVLLILAGVSIGTLMGEGGILTKANNTKLASEQAEILEKLRLEIYENRLDIENNVTEIEFLKAKGIIVREIEENSEGVGNLGKYASISSRISVAETNSDFSSETIYYIIDITKVVQNASTGKGSWETGDVYYILNGVLYYKNKEKQSEKQGEIFKEIESTANIKWIYHENEDGNIEITGIDIRGEDRNDLGVPENQSGTAYHPTIIFYINTIIIPESIEGKKVVKFDWNELSFEPSKLSNSHWFGAMGGDLMFTNIKKIIFPDTIEEISFPSEELASQINFGEVGTIRLPSQLKQIPIQLFERCSSIKNIVINEQSPNYSTENGVLFNKEKTELLYYPNNKTITEYTVPDTITSIKTMIYSDALEIINVPKSVSSIIEGALSGMIVNFENGKNENLIPQEDFWWGAKKVTIEGVEVFYNEDVGAACVSGESKILTSLEGKTMKAKEMTEGNNIVYYNFETGELEIGEVMHKYIHKDATDFVRYIFEDESYLEVTDYHPIYTTEGWKSYTRKNGYEKPQINDLVKSANKYKKIIKIETWKGLEDYYDFSIKTKNDKIVNNYFANETLVQSSY